MTDQLLALAVMLHADHDQPAREHLARLAGRLGYIAVHVPSECSLSAAEVDSLVLAADPAMVVVDTGENEPGRVRSAALDVVRRARHELDASGDRRPLVVDVPISIGRTRNEAVARADRDPRFVGDDHPAVSGVFGTFEQAQVQVLGLAEAGADVLLVSVPDDLDVADVLAQVRAVVVGATPALFNRGERS
jgi:alkanesulfonate monooxygenase SsuD/methylene tetrahydromethanopterin reductase-like flavin-dependent oxidoreductase (luciferase family)